MRHLILFFLMLAPLLTAGRIDCDVAGTLTFSGRPDGSAAAFFYPANGSLSATAEACLGQGAHFNWYQIVQADPIPPRNATTPYVDPQPGGNAFVVGGWRDGLPWYYDEQLPSGNCIQNGVDTCKFYDPIAWQVSSPCLTYVKGQACPMYNYIPTRDIMAFSDLPQNPQASIQLHFETRLVIVSADEQNWAYVRGFAWDWANPSPYRGQSSNFRALSASELVNPPDARLVVGAAALLAEDLPMHSSLGFPPNPLLAEGIADVPEPSAFALVGLGLIPLFVGVRRRRRSYHRGDQVRSLSE